MFNFLKMKQKKDSVKYSTRNYKNRILTKNSPFAMTESFKKLRTNILYATPGNQCSVIGITSAFQETGKSIVTANLAISFSQLDKKTLIIDCDLRKSAQHRIFGVENKNGVSEILAGIASGNNCTVKKLADYPNLSVMTAGMTPPNPAELLASDNMKRLIEALKSSFDIILIDLPPINVVTDASVIAHIVDGYLFVVRLEHDDVNSVSDGIAALEQTESKILGVIVNDINPKKNNQYYKRRYGYKYSNYRRKYYSYSNDTSSDSDKN